MDQAPRSTGLGIAKLSLQAASAEFSGKARTLRA